MSAAMLEAVEARGHRVRCTRAALSSRAMKADRGRRGRLPRRKPLIRRSPASTRRFTCPLDGLRRDFEVEERAAARNFARAAARAGVKRIIYLGGLGDGDTDLSAHLRSRQVTGAILRESGAVVLEMRASVILGSGSLSFELIRALVERLPLMICPRWVRTPAQPISIEDVIAYLIAAIDIDARESRVFEIGGADRVSYADIMREYACQRGLRRWLVFVPFTPRLSSLGSDSPPPSMRASVAS
jgi:uncharacterized protein YbjT (DUF2867 family)